MRLKLTISLLFLIVMIVVMRLQGNLLVNPIAPLGIVSLEFAGTPLRVAELMSSWHKPDVIINVVLDFVFILSYTVFLYLLTFYVGRNLNNRFFRLMLFLPVVAGVADVIENCSMLVSINSSNSTVYPTIVYAFAIIKFTLLIIDILFIIFMFIASVLRRNSHESIK